MYTFADRVYLALLRFRTFRRERRRWSESAGLSGEPRVFYGLDHIPRVDEKASGGMIKCQDLSAIFPNTLRDANLLYWVSSMLPHHASLITRFARKAGLRVVLNQNGVAYPGWHGPGWEESNRPMAFLHRDADYVFYQSEFCRLSAERYLCKRTGPSETLYNAVDTQVFTPRERMVGDPAAPVLLISGSHHARYRIECAVEVLRLVRQRLPRARMIVAGRYCWTRDETAALADAQSLARARGVADAVEWRGLYSQVEAVELFQSAGILLHTVYNDCCPRLVLEAMACGLPIAYSASGGVPELVGPDAGIGAPAPLDWERLHPPVPGRLAEAVLTMAANREAFSRAARVRAVECFDIKPWLERHRILFADLAK